MNKIIKIVGIFLLLLTFFLILFNLDSEFIKDFDEYAYNLMQTINTPITTELAKIITFLSNPEFALFIIVLCVIFVKNKNIRNLILTNAIIVTLINQIIKRIVARPRPDEWMLIEEMGFSFPSAHAMFSFAFYGLFLYFINKSNIEKKWKILSTILLVFLIMSIPITRIYLGVHYASDVVAGLCLSGVILIIYSFFIKKEA